MSLRKTVGVVKDSYHWIGNYLILTCSGISAFVHSDNDKYVMFNNLGIS